jgi:hypothetical protein
MINASQKLSSVGDPQSQGRQDELPGILTQLGLVLTPVGIIALFCQVLDASPKTTGVASIASVSLTSICIYRRFINRRVPSALLSALLIGLGVVFFANYQNILVKDTGLIKYYRRSNDFLAQIDLRINTAQQEIWFVGMNFNITAGERRDILLNKLAKGVKIRYLILNPRSIRIDDLATDVDQSPAELRSECEKGLQSILELRRLWEEAASKSSTPGELEVRVFELPPHARFYVFDPGRNQGTTFYVPYMNKINSPDLPGYLLENVESGVFGSYFGGIRKLWQISVSLDNVLPRSNSSR